MSIATLAKGRAMDAAARGVPIAYAALSRHLLSNPKALFGSRSISTSPPSLLPNQFNFLSKPSYSPLSPPSDGAFHGASRQFSTNRHLDPYERFMRRTAINWGVRFVPQQEAYVNERFGKFHKVLEAGLHVLVPVVDQIAYIHSLKEQTIEIPEQPAVTTDNVSIRVNGVLFAKVIDAERASYGNDNVMYAVTQLAQTVMRSAIGKMPLDKTFRERETLNANIVEAITPINDVASQWGLTCRHYEIRDIIPPPGIRDSMVMQAEAERRKRAEIIEAEGKRQAVILTSEAAKMDKINRATGEAEAIRIIAESLQGQGGQAAASLKEKLFCQFRSFSTGRTPVYEFKMSWKLVKTVYFLEKPPSWTCPGRLQNIVIHGYWYLPQASNAPKLQADWVEDTEGYVRLEASLRDRWWSINDVSEIAAEDQWTRHGIFDPLYKQDPYLDKVIELDRKCDVNGKMNQALANLRLSGKLSTKVVGQLSWYVCQFQYLQLELERAFGRRPNLQVRRGSGYVFLYQVFLFEASDACNETLVPCRHPDHVKPDQDILF